MLEVHRWRSFPTRVALAVALATLGACTRTSGQRPGPEGTGPPAEEVVPALWYPVTVTATTAHILVATGGCIRYHHATVTADGADARLTAFVASPAKTKGAPERACTDDLRATPAAVPIPAALRGRRLVGFCSPDAPEPAGSECGFLVVAANGGPPAPSSAPVSPPAGR